MEAASIFWGSVHIKVEILLYINWRRVWYINKSRGVFIRSQYTKGGWHTLISYMGKRNMLVKDILKFLTTL